MPPAATRLLVTTLAVLAAAAALAAQRLTVQLVGNAGVLLIDGSTSLLVDLPYESGAFGYDHYDLAAPHPAGTVVSVVATRTPHPPDHRSHIPRLYQWSTARLHHMSRTFGHL